MKLKKLNFRINHHKRNKYKMELIILLKSKVQLKICNRNLK